MSSSTWPMSSSRLLGSSKRRESLFTLGERSQIESMSEGGRREFSKTLSGSDLVTVTPGFNLWSGSGLAIPERLTNELTVILI